MTSKHSQPATQMNNGAEHTSSNKKRAYYPYTSAQQRRVLFETWLETDNIALACHKAGVSRSTFYYWRPRFLEKGFSALEKPYSNAPKKPKRIPTEVAQEVCRLKRENARWGKLRIANLINEKFGRKVIGVNTVQRVLVRAGLHRKGKKVNLKKN